MILRRKPDHNKVMHRIQKAMLKHAQDLAQINGAKLDYSDESCAEIDRVFYKIVDEFRQLGLVTSEQLEEDDGVRGIAHALGFYLAECIERNYGKGTWLDTDPDTGETIECFVLPDRKSIIFPFHWIMHKFIEPGEYSIEKAYRKAVNEIT